MTLSADTLLNYRVPQVRQAYTPRDCALYALSVGLGQDPMDERQLGFVDHCRADHRAMPAMVLVLGYPGFWLARPDTTAEASRLLHGEQSIRWHAPLPPTGDVLGRTRVTRVVDKGAGGHALVLSEREIVDAASGRPIATLEQTHVLRGQGGFGGDSGPIAAPHRLPERGPDRVVELPTRPEQALLYRLNGDTFALHADPQAAARAGFARPILHGMCTAALVMHALLRALAAYDASRFVSLRLRFSAPVFPGDSVRTDIWNDGSFRATVAERVVIDNGQLMLTKGTT